MSEMDPEALDQIEVSLTADVARGKLKPEDVERERARRVAVAALSPTRSYPDAITSPVDPPSVDGTDVSLPT